MRRSARIEVALTLTEQAQQVHLYWPSEAVKMLLRRTRYNHQEFALLNEETSVCSAKKGAK